jgi:predicted enzyme related to lactoylglutathione lyase
VSQHEQDRRIDYVEFPTRNIDDTKRFFSDVFGWEFTDYGPDYTSFNDGRLSGGFEKSDAPAGGGPLIVIYATDLEAIKESVIKHGGSVARETYEFPGGRRFHFNDPSGNELAVWSDS